MAQRVLTGCRDCVKCNTANVVKGARNLGRGFMAVLTVGGSEIGMALTGTCGTCGHQMSLHRPSNSEPAQTKIEASSAQARFQDTASQARDAAQIEAVNKAIAASKARKAAEAAALTTSAQTVTTIEEATMTNSDVRAEPSDPVAPKKVLPPAGFYDDPKPDPSQLRWWDGTAWTAFTKPKG